MTRLFLATLITVFLPLCVHAQQETGQSFQETFGMSKSELYHLQGRELYLPNRQGSKQLRRITTAQQEREVGYLQHRTEQAIEEVFPFPPMLGWIILGGGAMGIIALRTVFIEA